MVDFTEFMNVPLGEMKRTVLPVGHYFARIKSYEPTESGEWSSDGRKHPQLKVVFTLDSAGEDMDTASLPDTGVQGRAITVNYPMDVDFGKDRIGKLIAAAGIPTDPSQGWGTYLPQLPNQPVKLYIVNRRRDKNDPASELMDDVEKVLPAE